MTISLIDVPGFSRWAGTLHVCPRTTSSPINDLNGGQFIVILLAMVHKRSGDLYIFYLF
jgi:hypothetical protein